MDLGCAVHGCKQHFVVVKGVVEVSIDRDHWGGVGLLQEVKCDLHLGGGVCPIV